MSNFFSIPFRTTTEVSTGPALREVLGRLPFDFRPEAFNRDIAEWDRLRKVAFSRQVKKSSINEFFRYNALLLSALQRIPHDTGMAITYYPVFRSAKGTPITVCNLHFERLCVVYNLAALYSHLAKAEYDSDGDLKVVGRYCQLAAGTLFYLSDSALPPFERTHPERVPPDVTAPFFQTLRWVMLAQAQEMFHQSDLETIEDNDRFCRAAPKSSKLYKLAHITAQDTLPSVVAMFPSHWAPLFFIKSLYFDAYALFLAAPKGLVAWSRLNSVITRCLALCKETGPCMSQGMHQLVEELRVDISKATADMKLLPDWTDWKRDWMNELPSSKVDLDSETIQMILAPELSDSIPISSASIFRSVPPLGMDIPHATYHHAINTFIEDQVLSPQRKLDAQILTTLEQLDLPEGLSMIDGIFGVPPNLILVANQVHKEGGRGSLDDLMVDLNARSEYVIRIVTESVDIIQGQYANEEREAWSCGDFSGDPWNARMSNTLFSEAQEQQKALKAFEQEHVQLLNQSTQTENGITTLCQPVETLGDRLPSGPVGTPNQSLKAVREFGPTQLRKKLQSVKELLGNLDTVMEGRSCVVNNALALAAIDWPGSDVHDSRSSITIDKSRTKVLKGLRKYEQFKKAIHQGKQLQDEILGALKTFTADIKRLSKTDRTCQERLRAIDVLEEASLSYARIKAVLQQRMRAYDAMETRALKLRDEARAWALGFDKKAKLLDELSHNMTTWVTQTQAGCCPSDRKARPRSQAMRSLLMRLPSLDRTEAGAE